MATLTGKTFIGTYRSDKLVGSKGDDIFIYTLNTKTVTQDIYTGAGGTDTLQLQLSRDQWTDAAIQSQIMSCTNYLNTAKKNIDGEIGFGTYFTFKFGDSTLTMQMMEALRVMVDVNGDGNYVKLDLVNDPVIAKEDSVTFVSPSVDIKVLANDSVPDLVRTLAFDATIHATLPLTYGTATLVRLNPLNASTWYFTYSLDPTDSDYIALGKGITAEDKFSYKVTDANGDTGTAQVKVTVVGVYDHEAEITDGTPSNGINDFKGEVTEAGSSDTVGKPTASGQLTVTDPDFGENKFIAVVAGTPEGVTTFGTFTITAEGAWTYALDNDNNTVKALNTNSPPLEDTFKVSSLDGTATETVTITINGADDVVIGPPVTNDVLWVTSGTVVTLSTKVLLKNDSGWLGGYLTVTGFDLPTISLNDADNTFSFTSGEGGRVDSPRLSGFNYYVMDSRTNETRTGSVYVNTVGVSTTEANTVILSSKIYDGAYLVGGSGGDTFTAGSGDTVMVAGENDVIVGGPGIDTIFLALSSSTDFTAPDKVENVTVTSAVIDSYYGLYGNDLNNILIGTDFRDSIYGGLGNDILRGMAGGDLLFGEEGDDQLFGGEGNDVLYDFRGNNTLEGGSGADIFMMFNNSKNTVLDFSSNDGDKINISRTSLGLNDSSAPNPDIRFDDNAQSANYGELLYNGNTGKLFFGIFQIGLIGEDDHQTLTLNDFVFS